MQQAQGSNNDGLTIDVIHAGPPLDRWMHAVVHRNGEYEWSCSHRHVITAKAQLCAIRARNRIRRNDTVAAIKAAKRATRNVTP